MVLHQRSGFVYFHISLLMSNPRAREQFEAQAKGLAFSYAKRTQLMCHHNETPVVSKPGPHSLSTTSVHKADGLQTSSVQEALTGPRIQRLSSSGSRVS